MDRVIDLALIREFMDVMYNRIGVPWDCASLQYFSDGSGQFLSVDGKEILLFGWDQYYADIQKAMVGYMELYVPDRSPKEDFLLLLIKGAK